MRWRRRRRPRRLHPEGRRPTGRATTLNSRERVLAALIHREPDRVPVDFGSTSVTGIHVSCVAALRDRYGLERRPVKVHEPYQMLGLLDDDLKQVLGVDVDGVFPPRTLFGFAADGWKPWRTQQGLDVLVPGDFNTTTDEKGDVLIYPEGDRMAPPSGRMPRDGFFFDTIVRQEPIDDDHLDPEANFEEFEPIADADVEYFRRVVAAAAPWRTAKAIVVDVVRELLPPALRIPQFVYGSS